MAPRPEIKTADLRAIVNAIFDHIETDLRIDHIALEEDAYWEVAERQRFDMTKVPDDIRVGQLYDDWHFMKAILEDRGQAVSLMLVHVAAILRFAGERIGQ